MDDLISRQDAIAAMEVLIDNLCAKIGTTAELLIPEYARMRIAESTIGIFAGMVFIFAVVCLCRSVLKRMGRDDQIASDDEIFMIQIIFILLFLLFAAGLLFSSGAVLVRYIASPTAAFVDEVLHGIK